MRNGERRLTQQQILWLSSIIAIIMVYFVIVLPRRVDNNTLTQVAPPNDNPPTHEKSTSTPAHQLTQIPQSNPPQVNNSKDGITPSIYSTPQIGAHGFNLPYDFRVGTWHDNSCDDSLPPYTVHVYSVEIQGGTPPFEFIFWQEGKVIAHFSGIPQNGEIKFKTPIALQRGPYSHVKITFQSQNGSSEWEDDLRYPKDPQCLRP